MTANPNVPDPLQTKRIGEEFLILTAATAR